MRPQRLITGKLPLGGSTSASLRSKNCFRCRWTTYSTAAASESNGSPSGTEMARGGLATTSALGSGDSPAGAVSPGAARSASTRPGVGLRPTEGSRRVTSTVNRSALPTTVRAISKSSIVRQEARIVFTKALKLVSSG